VGFQHETSTTQLVQDGNVSGLDVTATTGGRAIGGFSSNGEGLHGEGDVGVYGSGSTYGVSGSGNWGVKGLGQLYGVYGLGLTNGIFGETNSAGGSGVYVRTTSAATAWPVGQWMARGSSPTAAAARPCG
jgi:hypothetical protein